MGEHPLNKPFETSGDWYLPDTPGKKVFGNLYYSPEKIELQLNGFFRPFQDAFKRSHSEKPYPVIHGFTREGEAVTLFNSICSGITLSSRSGGTGESEKMVSTQLMIGAHGFPDSVYPNMEFRVPGLQVWLSRKNIDVFCNNESGEWVSSYHLHDWGIETTPVLEINSAIDWGIGFQSSVDVFTSLEVKVSGWVTIRPDTPQPIDWYFKNFTIIATMLMFITNSPKLPDCIKTSAGQKSTGESIPDISIMVTWVVAGYCSFVHPLDFYMRRDEMGISLPEVVQNWFTIYPRVEMPSQLARSVLSSEKLWEHVEFLSLLQALEGFHRGMYEGKYMAESEYESVKNVLCNALPSNLSSDHKNALRSRIRYGNQLSLRKRLNELAGRLSKTIRLIILGGDGKVPIQWINTRNYYTHWDEELRSEILDLRGIFNANIRISQFLRALYLDSKRIQQDAILKSLQNSSRTSQHLTQLNARESV